ncbi:MAG: DUF2868 domain-containing protein [Burkholderiaceae bacterium]
MNEAAARQVLLVRALESTPGAPWSPADRDWADAQACRAGPADAGTETLIAARAARAVERLASRDPSLAAWLAWTAAPAWATTVVIGLAALLGLASDALGAARRVDLLAPPLLALMGWNLIVYAVLALSALRRTPDRPGPLRSALLAALQRLGGRLVGGRRTPARMTFVADWMKLGRPLHQARIARALHLAAAAFALGALASLYARGLAFEYSAGWDSTFLDAAGVRRLLAVVLWPASALAGFTLPDVPTLAALRYSAGPGENAARWIHAHAIGVVAVVVLPRLLLATAAGWRAARTARNLPLALDGSYFDALAQRLAGARARRTQVPSDPANPPRSVALSLVSHTNVGKTTLARTLLREDVGEVRDAQHVTDSAEAHTLIESDAGDRLELWDTPGFGDSVRLAGRLAQSTTPVGWFLGEVWDRVRDRAFWSSQRAVRNVFERSDVVLYLVDAQQGAGGSEMVDAELQVLELLRKPVIVLLNRLGAPRPAAEQADDVAAWRRRLAGRSCVREVLALDAFTRCWIQEDTLLDAVARVLPSALQPSYARLQAAWHARSQAVWRASMHVLAQRLARAALDRETVGDADWIGRFKDIGSTLGLRPRGDPAGPPATARERAMRQLAERLAADVRASTDQLIHLHGLGGHATDEVLGWLAEHYAAEEPLDEGRAALWGGIASGALVGLKADLASGGLTLGGGMLAGGIVGALGAAGLARGYNQVRGLETPALAWSPAALDAQLRAALLGYLAVAHHGRGRGAWSVHEQPRFWLPAVDAALASQRDRLHTVWSTRDATPRADLGATLESLLQDIGASTLGALYPQSSARRHAER